MPVIYVIRSVGSTLILTSGSGAPLPTLYVAASFRSGEAAAPFRIGETVTTFRSGEALAEAR